MFKPEYRITNHFLSCLTEITRLSEKIIQTKIRLPLKLKIQRDAITLNTYSSTSIEGNTLSLNQVSKLVHHEDVAADDTQKKEVLNYINVMNWILKHPHLPITEMRLLRLHQQVMHQLLPKEKSGHYKTKNNVVVDSKKIVIFRPPGPERTPKLISELLEWINTPSNIHPMIKSAIFHHQFVTIHPFSDGNGRLARCISEWILYHHQFYPYHLLSLDTYYANDRQKYYQKIQQARDLDFDFTYWIEYVAEGISSTLKKLFNRIQQISSKSSKEIELTPKQIELIEHLQSNGALGSKDIGEKLKISRARVNQLILPLVKTKIIQKEGKARATRYLLS